MGIQQSMMLTLWPYVHGFHLIGCFVFVCEFVFVFKVYFCVYVGKKGTSGAQDFVELELKAVVSNSTFLWRVGSTSKH